MWMKYFFSRSNKASLPERGRPRALSVCLWDWALPKWDFFFIHRSRNTMKHSLEFVSLYFPCEHSEICNSIIYCALLVFLDCWMHQKTQNLRDEPTAMETHFYTMETSFFFHENFSIYIQKHSLQFFLMLFTYFQKNECKNLEIQEERQEQWNPTSTAWIFFSFTKIFQNTIRNILYNFFFMLFSYFQNNECKKTRNSRGTTRAMEFH